MTTKLLRIVDRDGHVCWLDPAKITSLKSPELPPVDTLICLGSDSCTVKGTPDEVARMLVERTDVELYGE